MGQRLVIKAVKDDETVAALYKHWDAYTLEAIDVLSDLHDIWNLIHSHHFNENESTSVPNKLCSFINGSDIKTNPQLMAIRIFELYSEQSLHTSKIEHPGIHPSDIEFISNKYPDKIFHNCIDRNVGIISVSPETISNMSDTADGLASIDLDTGKISFDVCYNIDTTDIKLLEETLENYDLSNDEFNNIPKLDIDFSDDMTIEQLKEYGDCVKLTNHGLVLVKSCNGLELIEPIK